MTLERDLRALADGFPETPSLAPRVLVAIERAGAQRRRRRRIAVLAFALFLLVPATALGVSPDLRHRVLETFGLRDVTVERVDRLPPVGPEAQRLDLGPRVTLAQARADLQLRIHPPSLLGAPDGIYTEQLVSGVDVTFLYQAHTVAARIGARKRVLVSIVRGSIEKKYISKTIGAATSATMFEIDGGQALLLTGARHLLLIFRTRDGFDEMYTRFAGTTLLWQRKAMLIRVEGGLPRDRLVQIARSISTG